ncbi:hypothetical protein [Streptococcus salivarius]|jgi:hypothetical protein|uniref:hypothetical protein n=1 Tax=Streptococcus salivarius TaxID=1304 RepID=UPI000E51FFB3|nr:hypothetical protein [Streptococcus salivarius]RGS18427.1 hypothetical protein DWY09_07345 [Streptococcus salivarius]
MAKITKLQEVLQSADYSTSQVPIKVRQGAYENKDGVPHIWVHLDCVDSLLYSNAESLGIDPDELPTVTVKVKNPDSRDWETLIGEVIVVTSATVVPIISNNQLKGLALSVDCSEL